MESHPYLNGTSPVRLGKMNDSSISVLSGIPCDRKGNYLPDGSSPPPPTNPSESTYAPFESRAHFELADLLFRKIQLSAGKTDQLLQLIAALGEQDREPPSWGALRGSLLVPSYGTGKLFLAPFETVGGASQGAYLPLPVPAAPTGLVRGRFRPDDGHLYVVGMFAWNFIAAHWAILPRLEFSSTMDGDADANGLRR